MNLQSYIGELVTILNNVVIPFILGISFLVFVINVIRFFVIGGTNEDAKEKAKQLAIYGVAAFVFIIVFWGIVNLLTSSFGLQRLGNFESRCSDYECPDGNNPTLVNGSDFSSSPTQIGSGGGAETGFGATVPSQTPGQSIPSQPGSQLSSPSLPSSSFTTEAPADYSAVTRDARDSVEDVFPTLETTLLTDQFDAIGNEQLPDSVRVNNARAFANAGIITESDFDSVLTGINSVRAQGNFPPISSSFAVADPAYTADLETYNTAIQAASDQLTQWYGGSGQAAESAIISLFNTELSLESRYAAVSDVLSNISSPDPDFNATLEEKIMTALNTERDYTERPD